MSNDVSERDPVEVLAEEFLDRRRRNETPTPDDYARRYPEWAEKIRTVFPALMLLDELTPQLTSTPSAEAPKQLGEFRIIRQIGRGGMGVVYEAIQQSLERRVALKVLPQESARDPVYLDRFRSEARTAARLHHTNIVAIHGAGQADGVHFLVMQLISGVGLDAVLGELRRARPATDDPAANVDRTLASGLSTTDDAHEHLDLVRLYDHDRAKYYRAIARLMAEAADALAHAHQFGVVHRDVKPSNLLLAHDGSLFVSDFGLAKAEGAADLTRTGLVVGTPRYVAPERFNGIEGPGSDVFALGATLYELLTLRPAFDAPTRERLIEQVRNVEPVPPRSLNPDVPRDLETLALSSLAKEPLRRPSAAALAEDLHRWLTGRPIRARRIGPLERLAIWARRNPLVASLTAGLFLALTAGLGVALGLWRTSEGHRTQAVANAETADRRREQSEETLNKSLDAMDEYFRKVCEDKLLEAPGMLGLRRELLASAVPYYEAFLATHDANPRLKVESLRAKASLARVKVSMGTKQDAAAALDGALAACRGLLEEMPDNQMVRRELARTLEAMARVKTSQSQTVAADHLYREAAAAYAWFGDPASQLNSIRALLATADAAYNLNRMAQVQADMKEIRRRLDELAHSVSDVPAFQQVNARAHIYQASYLQKDSPADAHRSAEQACAIMEELTAKFPNQPFYRFELAAALAERGIAERQLKRPADAKLSLTAGRTILQRLHAENPLENDYATRLVANYRAASSVEQDLGQFNDALTLLLAARQLLAPHLAADAADTRLLRIMAEVTSHMGFLFDKLNRDEESYEAHGAAGDAFAKLHEREPEFIGLLTNLGVCRRNQALTCMRTNRAEEGAQLAREAVASYLKALAISPNTSIAKTAETRLYPAYRTLIDCHQQMGRWDLIEADFAEVLTVRPTTVAMRVNVAKIYAEFAEKALGQVGPPSPNQSERFQRFAGLAVQTLRAASQEDVEAVRKAFKIEVFRPILHVEAFQQAVAEFQLPLKAADK